jgi:hypothetical protein
MNMPLRKRESTEQSAKRKLGRQGTPLTVYFTKEQANQLSFVSRERHVAKSTLVRFAVEQLLNQLTSGQLELPLGL